MKKFKPFRAIESPSRREPLVSNDYRANAWIIVITGSGLVSLAFIYLLYKVIV